MINHIKLFVILAISFLVLLALSCRKDLPDFERTTFKINNQNFEILTAFNLFDNFINETKKSNIDFIKASNRLIYRPIKKEFLNGAEVGFIFNSIKIPFEQNEYLDNQLEILKSGGLAEIIKDALTEITDSLPGPDTKIIIIPANRNAHTLMEKLGSPLNCVTIGSGKIIMTIDPTMENWKNYLRYGLAHEYHHSTWISLHWKTSDLKLIDFLILEGRADNFAESIFSGLSLPWTNALTTEQEKVVWTLIEPDIFLPGVERINEVFYGTDKIPVCSGYEIGSHIVQSFLNNNPHYSAFETLSLDPIDLYKMSGYTQTLISAR